MPIDDLHTKGDLSRFIERKLAEPGILPAPSAPISAVVEGEPNDSHFPATPGDCIFAYDKEASTLYVRVDGEWRAV